MTTLTAVRQRLNMVARQTGEADRHPAEYSRKMVAILRMASAIRKIEAQGTRAITPAE